MNKNLFLDVEDNPKRIREWILFGVQHILAMLVACITVPLLTGLPVAATLISAGMGTLIYILCTKKQSPVFLSSSFAYLSPMFTALAVGGITKAINGEEVNANYAAVIIGMVLVGLVYVVIALIIRFVGTKWLNKLLPPVIVGPVIMVIGLGLSASAISNLTKASGSGASYNWLAIICGLVAMIATACAAHYGKNKFLSLIPFVVGMGSGYLLAVILTLIGFTACGNEYFNIVDFTPFIDIFGKGNFSFASIFNYKLFVPNSSESFIFLRFDQLKQFDWATIGEIILLFVPVAFVTVCEHVGDHENLGNIIGRDLLNGEPGMKRTLMGDGIATAVSGVLCGAANTTYGENVAVIGTTRIASVNVVLVAALMAIGVGFVTPFTALLSTIPCCVTGGVSLILYGFIASSGIKMLIAERMDFNVPKNMFIASVILVAGIGDLAFNFFANKTTVTEILYFTDLNKIPSGVTAWTPMLTQSGDTIYAYVHEYTTIGGYTLNITSIAVAMILGILLNVILRDPKVPENVTEEINQEQTQKEEKASE